MHKKNILQAGKPIDEAKKVLIMLHGRGASAADILSIASYLHVEDFALLAPEATGHSWYPYSFLAPVQQNEPWLSSALELLKEIVDDLHDQGIANENIYFMGFSQGACLTLEFVTRNATKWGGVAAFTGGLIGAAIDNNNYKGDFQKTPIFIGTSNPDPHVPVDRVLTTATILTDMNAEVVKNVYKNMGHTINEDEINNANTVVFKR
jgi:phospholipase/carboxylesterase